VPGVQHDRQRHLGRVGPDRVEARVVGAEVTHRAVQLQHPQAHVLHRAAQHGERLLVTGMDGAPADHPDRAAAPRGGQAGHGLVQVLGRTGTARVGQRPHLADPFGGEPVAHLRVVRGVREPAAVDPMSIEEPADRGLEPGRQEMDMRVNDVSGRRMTRHRSGLPGPPKAVDTRVLAGQHSRKQPGRKSFSADETQAHETSGDLVARTVITKGLVFDGSGTPPVPGEVTLADDRVVSVTPGHHDNHGRDDHGPNNHGTDRVIDATGCTVMPGLIESHGHLTFPSAVGHIDPTFNPPLDVSFFRHIQGMDAELARAERNAKILLDAGFTSVGLTSSPVTVAPRAAASSSSRPLPQPASSRRVPAVTAVAASTASNSGRVCGSMMPGRPRTRAGIQGRRLARGPTQRGLAGLIWHSLELVAKAEKAERWPSWHLATQCDVTLRTGGLLARLWPAVERQRLASDQRRRRTERATAGEAADCP
jgi:hypothetical protein